MEKQHSSRIKKLDGLRGFFCLMVVLLHVPESILPESVYSNFIIRESQIFVDFFFVLSGFVITANYSQIKGLGEWWKYLKKRVIRLYPLLFAVCTFTLVYFLITMELLHSVFPHLFDSASEHLPWNIWNLYLDNILFLNSTPILGEWNGIVGQSWSISSEMISYLVFGFVSLIIPKQFRWLGSVFIILAGAAFLWWYGKFFTAGDYGFVRGLIGFNAGVILYEISSNRRFKIANAWEWLIIPVVVAELYVLHLNVANEREYQITGMITVPILFSAIIYWLLQSDGIVSRLMETQFFQFLGRISYSIYLNHVIILGVGAKAIIRITHITIGFWSGIISTLLLIGIVLLISVFTYRYVEQGIGLRLKKWWL